MKMVCHLSEKEKKRNSLSLSLSGFLADGQFSKDELYTFSLRLNLFPRFHYFLKKQQETSQ